MLLALDTRDIGHVTVVRCSGRIVAGSESESLNKHVAWLLRDRHSIILNLGEVNFVDSSGLGAMVRSLTGTRQARGDLKLCNVPEPVRKVLELSRLTQLFDTHESEENAVAAFYRRASQAEAPARSGHSVLCLDSNPDVLAYLGELLRRHGHDVHTSSRIGDALLLMRVSRFDLVLLGPGMTASPHQGFQEACARLPVVELGHDFSTRDAGDAAAGLLENIHSRLNSKTV